MSDKSNPVQVLCEKLVAIVEEDYACLFQHQNAELEGLRAEVLKLRGDVARLEPNNFPSCVLALKTSPTLVGLAGDEPARDHDDIKVGFGSEKNISSIGLPSDAFCSESLGVMSDRTRFDGDATASAASATASGEIYSGTSAQHLRTLEDTEADIMDLKIKFKQLDPGGRGYINVRSLADYMTQHLNSDKGKKEDGIRRYRIAVQKLNKHIGILAHASESGKKMPRIGHIHFHAFKMLMLENAVTLHNLFGQQVTEALLEMREALVNEVMIHQIAQTLHVHERGICESNRREERKNTKMKGLESVVAVFIVVNALVIGISLDVHPTWSGWFVIETLFTLFFLFEFIFCLYVVGCSDHFLGQDWYWSWFDFIIVCSAVTDTMITTLAKMGVMGMDGINLNHLLVLRLVRLIRITRLIRILHLKMFKELTLMLNGVIAGLRTLFWAIVLLAIFIYAGGVAMRQTMDSEHREYECDSSLRSVECNRGERHMDRYGHIMFGNVGRSMLTILMCFTDGCNSPDGTPLIWHLWDTHGPVLVLGYILSFLFISFGVLNLIMAVFVENTLVNAMRSDAERQFGEQSNHMRRAQELQMLLSKFCKGYDGEIFATTESQAAYKRGLKTLFYKFEHWKSRSTQKHMPDPRYLHMRVSQDQFEEVLEDKEVNSLFDALDISCISRDQLFDILDADGNGYLAISELVDGIMKLRGPADKGDIVSTALMARQLQKQVSKFEAHTNRQFNKLDKLCEMLSSKKEVITL